jgi:spermidine/putrescine-binding protein
MTTRNHPTRLACLALALALLAAACGGDDDAGGEAVECEAGTVDGDLDLYNWSEYIDPELISGFESEFGVDVVESFYESNEAMLAQIQSGVTYDVVVPSDYMVGIMITEGILTPLDHDAIPNIENLAEDFSSPPYDPELGYSVAYQYGTTGLGVNTALTGADFPRSWALLFDPEVTSQFPVGVSALNDPRETIGAALKYLGYSLNSTDTGELQEATELISAARENIATFDSDQYDESLVNGEVAVAHGYSGNMIVAMGEAENPDDFEYVIPEEGATLWIDNLAIPAGAESPCTAHAFLNYLLDAENGAALTNWNYYGSPNAAAIDAGLVDQEVVDFYAETEEAEDLEVIEDTGEFEISYTDAFAEARS